MANERTCAHCRKRQPIENFATPRMRRCLSCQAEAVPLPENVAKRAQGRTVWSTPAGRAAILRIRRRDAKAEASKVLRKRGRPRTPGPNDPPPTPPRDLDKLRKCYRCQQQKPQRDFHPRSYVCFACDLEALKDTKPVGPPRGRNGGRNRYMP